MPSEQCGMCGVLQKEPYKCPRCSLLYCSIKCYRNPKHSECSEKFYQEQVKKELSGKRAESSEEYKEKMKEFLDGDWMGEEHGEPLDSDDEEHPEEHQEEQEYQEAMKRTVQGAIDDYELEDGELERRMLAAGLSDDVDELLNTLSTEERETFRMLAEQMEEEEHGMAQSCFGSKTRQ